MSLRRRVFFSTALFAIAALSATANAEEGIIVTAAKRASESAFDLPITMNVFARAELERRSVEDLQSLSLSMPNVQFEDIGTARGIANFSIRGVGVNSSIASVDPAVGVFVDGVYLGLNVGAISDLFDIEAIEVLRGPQGTLYGRNVTGGAVLVRSARPDDELEAHARFAVETGAKGIGEAAISGPLIDGVLAGRLAVTGSDDAGWFRNQRDGRSFGASESRAWRAGLLFTPTPAIEVLARWEEGDSEGDGPAGQNHALFSRDGFGLSLDNAGYAAAEWKQATLEANWRVPFGDGVITSITGWRWVEVPWAADIDSTPNFTFHTRVLNEQEQASTELRYAGVFGAFDVTAGVYFLDQNLLYVDERNFSPTFRRTGGGAGDFETRAAFLSVDWRASPSFTWSAGLRYTEEEKFSRISRVRRAADDLNGPTVQIPGEGVAGGDIDSRTLVFSDQPFDQGWEDFSPRFGVAWRPDSQTHVYASWARGFRSGGANFRTSTLGLAPRAYAPERQSTIEIGVKRNWADGRVALEAALFHNEIEDMQRETNLPDPISGVQQIILNAGDAELIGGEIEARLTPFEGLTLSAHGGYVEGSYENVTGDLNGDGAINAVDLGLEIPRLAPWTYGVTLDYARAAGDGVIETRLAFVHRDAAFYNDANTGRLAEIDTVDARVSFAPEAGGWAIALYGKNLADVATWGGDTVLPSTAGFGFSGGARPTFSPLNRGRVIGAELRWRY